MAEQNSNSEFVQWAFDSLLKRPASSSEEESLSTALHTSAMSRLEVLELIIGGIEFRNSNQHREFVPPGHFYSAVPSATDRQQVLAKPPAQTPPAGINLNHAEQRALLEKFALVYDESKIPLDRSPSQRYYANNPAFSWHDAFVLNAMIKHFKPSSIIEIGSGFSSAMTLDTVDSQPDFNPSISFIEPFPETLNSILRKGDSKRCTVLQSPVQDVPIERFSALKENDLLFIDSTHVSKLGSDVNFIYFEVLPRLNSGVVVHIHDIFYPFEYPRHWIEEGRAWNELYLVRALLASSNRYRILSFNHYLAQAENEYLGQTMPKLATGNCGSLWLKIV